MKEVFRVFMAALGSALLLACSGAPASPDRPAPKEPEPAAAHEPVDEPVDEPTEAHLLSGCEKGGTKAGALQLTCDGFIAILSRLTSEEPVDDAIVVKVEADMLAGMKASIKSGVLEPQELVVSNGERDVPITGFEVSRSEQTVMRGALMAVALDEAQVLTVTCFTKDPASAVCAQVMEQVLTIGLPEL